MILQKWQFSAEMTQLYWKKYFSKFFLFLKSQYSENSPPKRKEKRTIVMLWQRRNCLY
jgi:hypothetical protein